MESKNNQPSSEIVFHVRKENFKRDEKVFIIKKEDIVIYESMESPARPVVERVSGLKFNVDFFTGTNRIR